MIGLNFGLLGHIADVITYAKFCDNRFRGFGLLIPPILPFSIGIAGRPYNSLSTTVVHCDIVYTIVYTILHRQTRQHYVVGCDGVVL